MKRVDFQDLEIWRKSGGVYGIRCNITGKWYIGSVIYQQKKGYSRNFAVRLKEHINYASTQRHHNRYFQRAWDKYGQSSFEFYVLEEMMSVATSGESRIISQDIIEREQYYLDFFRATDPEFGFNMRPAENTFGWKHTPETISKLKILNSIRTPAREAASKKWIDLMVSRHKGKKRDPKVIQMLADSQRMDFAEVKQHFSDCGCELLQDSYVNAKTRLKYRCLCGNISYISWDSFRRGSRCSECKKRKISDRFTSIFLTFNGITKSLIEWSLDTGIKLATIYARYKKGKTPEDCFAELRQVETMTVDGETKSISEWALTVGSSVQALRYRKANGLSDEECVKKPVGEDFRTFEELVEGFKQGVPKRKSSLYVAVVRWRDKYKQGKLDNQQIEILEQIPWWSWSGPLSDFRKSQMLSAKSVFFAKAEINNWKILAFSKINEYCTAQCPQGHIVKARPENLKKAWERASPTGGCGMCFRGQV